jgi:hypothetical protein
MELLLNILWLFIAFGLLGLWRTRWARQQHPAQRDPLREWTAFSCTLVLLFFAVSLSDDLRAEIVFVEKCSSDRRQSLVMACPHQPEAAAAMHSGAPASVPQLHTFHVLFVVSALLHRTDTTAAPVVPSDTQRGRAPPSFIL